jgi:hypothetical protein
MRALIRLLNPASPVGLFLSAFIALTFYVWGFRIMEEINTTLATAIAPQAAATMGLRFRIDHNLTVSVSWLGLGLFISLFTDTSKEYGLFRDGSVPVSGPRDWALRYGWIPAAVALGAWSLALPVNIRVSSDPLEEGFFRFIGWIYRAGYFWGWLLFVAHLNRIWLNGRKAELYSLLVTVLYWGGRALASNPAFRLHSLLALPFAFVACILTVKLRRGSWGWTVLLLRDNLTRLL